MNNGMTVKDACKEVGMPRSTYYHIIAQDPEAIAIFQDIVVASTRERLWVLLVNQTLLLHKVIEDVVWPRQPGPGLGWQFIRLWGKYRINLCRLYYLNPKKLPLYRLGIPGHLDVTFSRYSLVRMLPGEVNGPFPISK